MRPQTVNSGLTLDDRPEQDPSRRPAAQSQRRSRGAVENTDYAAFAARVIRAHGGDVEGLAELLSLADELDAATRAAVEGLRGFGYSWGEIASRLGTTRQAAQQRWGR